MRCIFLLAAMVFAAVSCCQQAKNEIVAEFPARWILTNDGNLLYESRWTGEGHYLGSMNGNPATITIVSAKGDQDKFDYRIRGKVADEIARYNDAIVTHIGDAFMAVDPEKFDATLYNGDGHHQSHYGSYLKACVNYLTITGEPFEGYVPDCGIDPRRAEYLRSVAQQVILKK